MKDINNKAVLVGSGGHARVILEIIALTGDYEIDGIIDPRLEAGSSYQGVKVIGDDSMLAPTKSSGIMNAYIGVGSIKNNKRRNELYALVKDIGFHVPGIVHPGALVSKAETKVSEGVQIMAGAIVQAGSIIGENTIINTGAIIDHDCVIGNNVHICPGVTICGGTTICDNAFVGSGSTIIQGLVIGKDTIVGAGAVIKKDLKEGMLVRGGISS